MTIILARSIGIDLVANRLVVTTDVDTTLPDGTHEAIIDIGDRGALIGIDVGDHYIQITDRASRTVRSTPITIDYRDGRLTVPRRTDEVTIAWPSGNQCWRQQAGSHTVETCAEVLRP